MAPSECVRARVLLGVGARARAMKRMLWLPPSVSVCFSAVGENHGYFSTNYSRDGD